MRSCIRISSTKDEIRITVNAAAEFDEVLEEFRSKLPRIKKYYEKNRLPIHIVGKALKENEQTAVRTVLKPEIDTKITFGEASEVLGLHAIKRTVSPSPENKSISLKCDWRTSS